MTFDDSSVRNRLNNYRNWRTTCLSLYPDIDPEGLLEYSVVFTDRSLNHMSQSFQGVMTGISETLKKVYNAYSVVVVPGGGTFGMEAVARQFGSDKKCMVIPKRLF